MILSCHKYWIFCIHSKFVPTVILVLGNAEEAVCSYGHNMSSEVQGEASASTKLNNPSHAHLHEAWTCSGGRQTLSQPRHYQGT